MWDLWWTKWHWDKFSSKYLYFSCQFNSISSPYSSSSTGLLTPWCRVLLEKLTSLQLVKKFPAYYGTRRFVTALTSVRHLSLSWAIPIQSIYPHPTSWRSILILSTHLGLGLPSGLLRSGFPTKTLYTPSPHRYAPHAQPISFFSILSPAQYWVRSTDHLAHRYAISSIPPLLIYMFILVKGKNGRRLGKFRTVMQRTEHRSISSSLNDNQVASHPLSKASIRLKIKATQVPTMNTDNYKLRCLRY